MTIATELGDKTFCIAAVMAMKYPRAAIFAGAIGALATMTVLSVGIGVAVPALLPKVYTHYAAAALFAYFGVKLLREARAMSKEEADKDARARSGSGPDGSAGSSAGGGDESDHGELAEAEEEVAKLDLKLGGAAASADASTASGASSGSRTTLGSAASAASSGVAGGVDIEAGAGSPGTTAVMPSSSAASARARKGDAGSDASPAAAEGSSAGSAVAVSGSSGSAAGKASGSVAGPGILGWLAAAMYLHVGANWPVFTHSFSITFLAEWGDRSQIATIAMAAAANPFGVCLGAAVGHALCTGLAVMGGRMLASRISEKTVAYVGGVLFLLFALHSLVVG